MWLSCVVKQWENKVFENINIIASETVAFDRIFSINYDIKRLNANVEASPRELT